MKFFSVLHRRLHWLNLPGTVLIALLQRTPAVRLVATAGDYVLTSPLSAVLKSAAATLGALGAVHTMAGASAAISLSASSSTATVGTAKTIAFTVTNAQGPAISWTVGGVAPSGMTFTGGVTTGIINTPSGILTLSGTPTTAGTFVMSLKAWESANGTGTASSTFQFAVTVAAAANSAPTITTQPANATVSVGGTALLTAAVAGSLTPALQWYKGGVAIPGANSATLVISGAATIDAGSYTLVATNSVGSVTSNAAILTVSGGATLPAITVQPASATAVAGGSAVLAVVATGSPAYQWRKNGAAIAGATGASLSFASLTMGDTASYDVVLTNAAGTVTSAAATLIVSGPLAARLSNLSVRTTLAANQLLTVGLTVSGGAKNILVRAAGPGLGALGVPGTMADPKLALFNNTTQIDANDNWGGNPAVSAAMAAVGAFPFPSAASLDAALVAAIDGGRTVQVSGPAAGNVIVEAYDTGTANSPRLTNLSALNFVGTGGDVLIAGFTVAGTGTKNVLIRAAGPSLGALGYPGTLVDPKLVLQTSGQVFVAENDTYGASLTAVFDSVGAFRFVAGAKDAALIVSLPPGGYTVTVSGADGGTGAAIVEVYELP